MHNMLPKYLDYWFLEFGMSGEVLKKYPPARTGLPTWWFETQEEAEKFIRLTVPADLIDLAVIRLNKSRVVDIMTEEQHTYWSNLLSMHDKVNHLSFDYRHLWVGDDEQSRIMERAEEMSKEDFAAQYPAHLVELGKQMYEAALDDESVHFDRIIEALQPHIAAPELEEFDFSTWENVLYTEGDYEGFVTITKELAFEHKDPDTVRSKFTRV